MPSAQNPVSSRSEKARTGIYIARGADTLGPYDPDEAAALVVGGYLHTDDHAARDGDSVWVPLADFLPPSFRAPAAAKPTPPPRGRLAAAIFALVGVPLLVAGGVGWFENRHPAGPAAVQPTPALTPLPVAASTVIPLPTPAESAAPVVEAAPTAPPTPEPDGPLRGSLDLPVAGVRVAAYPLASLETALAPTAEAALLVRQRLDPQVDAAAAELATRAAEESVALRALNEAGPSDPLRRSLRFAYNGARTATRTAADNRRFLLEERATTAGGETFFRVLPAPALTVKTDAAGSFTLDLPPDGQPYVVAASVEEKADDGSPRTRRWLVRPSDAQRTGHAALRLDAGNDLSSDSADSLVHAAD